jgi:hypothetical protein
MATIPDGKGSHPRIVGGGKEPAACPFSSSASATAAAKKKNDDLVVPDTSDVSEDEEDLINTAISPPPGADGDESMNRMTDSLVVAFFIALVIKVVLYLYGLKYGVAE